MPSSALSSISISVSGDDADEPSGKTRLRARRRRWRPPIHGREEICRRMARALVRWWPVLLFLPAVVLLAFEASSISGNHDDDLKRDELVREEEVRGSLNRLDPMMRVVNGVKEPCLKILHPEEIQHLEFPADTEPKFPVKEVLYRSDSGTSFTGGNATLLHQYTEHARFNLFTGNQTLQEREESFKVNETLMVHCGFYSDIGGFKISDFDKSYLQTCKAVVSTCAFGGGDDLYQPIGMTDASLKKACYVAFWDEITLSVQEARGKKLGDKHMIGKWRIIVVRDLPFSDQRLNGKIPKMLSHRLFPQARYSIWVDSKSQFRRDPLGVLEVLLWRTNSVLAISEHGARSSVFDEGKAVVRKHKATPEEVKIQLTQYRRDGLTDMKRFNGKKALAEASIIVREHTPPTNLFMCLWFNEVVRFTSRDQLSFPYVLWRLNIPGLNMFPVCSRKDLGNSMGHRRKVRPLVRTKR